MSLWGPIRRSVFGLPAGATSYTQRGFYLGASDDARRRLERIGRSFVGGYHAALAQGCCAALIGELQSVEAEQRGFAFEGAAMGLALMDRFTPWRSARIREFLLVAGDAHAYMIHVGVGWVWARLPFGFRRAQRRLDPLLGWLAFDGWGFHEGFFHGPDYLAGKPPPKCLVGYARRVFDQGLGRSLWFVNGANPQLIAQCIHRLPIPRQADLWSGIGLAATYAEGVGEQELRALRAAAGSYAPQLAQGSAFAAKARHRAGNTTDYTALATALLCERSALDAARLCDTTLEDLPGDGAVPAYEIWRQRIQDHFALTGLAIHRQLRGV
jgi:hypothetical protein